MNKRKEKGTNNIKAMRRNPILAKKVANNKKALSRNLILKEKLLKANQVEIKTVKVKSTAIINKRG